VTYSAGWLSCYLVVDIYRTKLQVHHVFSLSFYSKIL
jgi:hypothetical protein